jgi:hypothetical protein
MRPVVFDLSCVFRSRISSVYVSTSPHCAQESIPEGEKRLAEVSLNAPALMVDIMVFGVVACDVLQRIERQSVSAMVVNRLDGATGKKPHALSNRHAYYQVRKACA